LWKPAARSLRISGNQLLLFILMLLGVTAMIITISRLGSIGLEVKKLERDARAIFENAPLTAEARKEAAMSMKTKGMGLKVKFTLALALLVLITILMIAVALGVIWISMERDTLSQGLESESRLLMETISTSAATIIPAGDKGGLLQLPDRIKALPDARWTTVTGPRGETGTSGGLRVTSDGYNYIWTTNDPQILEKMKLPGTLSEETFKLVTKGSKSIEVDILKKAYQQGSDGDYILNSGLSGDTRKALTVIIRRFNLMPLEAKDGSVIIEDELTLDIEQMRNDVLEAVEDADLNEMIGTLSDLRGQLNEELERILLSSSYEDPIFIEAGNAVDAQWKVIQTVLLDISNQFFSVYPEFNADVLRNGESDIFVFYKPILYLEENNPEVFKGVVRLAVSVDGIKTDLDFVQKRILLTTLIASVLALALGIIVALIISSLMLKPINSLVKGVSKIRDQPDMLQHEGFNVELKTRDELSELANTINGMVQGLIQAALEQKELVAGQEIQKTFLPLDEVEDSKGDKIKLSTGSAGNAFFRLFGYYEGADAVSGDYFDFRKLDDDHYVMIKLDIAGHGVTASLIMVQVAALYVDYFRKVRVKAVETGKLRFNLREFTFGINDLINEVGFRGRFAAFNLSVINIRTSEYEMIHAGDNLVHIYDGETRKMKVIELADAPAAGQIDSSMIEMNPTMYQVVKGNLNRRDILFLYTDGIEEAHHIL
ncbi:MAG: SpoIIE family protein phosphatase, partial [Spirochaetaceae bacterium]|nr:SpoIIE family protein phosphatase [Spirochaetaceae bacterium]